MEALQGSTERRAQLETWMDQRRRELRIRWSEVARRAGMSAQNLLRIRKGQISISWDAADGIEDALLWERGSVENAVTKGRRPTPRRDAHSAPQPAAETATAPRPPRRAWTPEMEIQFRTWQRVLAADGLEMTEENFESMHDQAIRKRAHESATVRDNSR